MVVDFRLNSICELLLSVSDIRKQNPNRIGNRFVNDKDAKKYLTAVNQAHWLEDEL